MQSFSQFSRRKSNNPLLTATTAIPAEGKFARRCPRAARLMQVGRGNLFDVDGGGDRGLIVLSVVCNFGSCGV